jgi:ABC-type dipeptide/oligopeptide/nickel transport system permease component
MLISLKKREWIFQKSFTVIFVMLFLLILFISTPGIILISLTTTPERTTDNIIEVWYRLGLVIIALTIYGFAIETILIYHEYRKLKKENKK